MPFNEVKDFISILSMEGQSVRAIGFLQLLIRENPDKPALSSLLADVMQESGDKSSAISALDSLGEELMKKGDTKGAIQIIEQILSMDPPNASDYQDLIRVS